MIRIAITSDAFIQKNVCFNHVVYLLFIIKLRNYGNFWTV
ncbi:hypothetical protein HMPREF9420_0608 [Segatella salivae DSM 15606]|uniref:Uncharacterized protein n=1 Tax=Segatella salivae DSM 15606 TaxID=888832 RepID=E6MM90_9BACT|nr:hypothetical protein HMPREF9420_0608 [Segatella salivae DSM 15606]